MSAPSPSWRAHAARWAHRAGAATAGAIFDAAVDSLGLGKRCIAWLVHAPAASSRRPLARCRDRRRQLLAILHRRADRDAGT